MKKKLANSSIKTNIDRSETVSNKLSKTGQCQDEASTSRNVN